MNIRPQFSLGCPEASQCVAKPEAMYPVSAFIWPGVEAGNNTKTLEARLGIYPLCFYAVVRLSGM